LVPSREPAGLVSERGQEAFDGHGFLRIQLVTRVGSSSRNKIAVIGLAMIMGPESGGFGCVVISKMASSSS